MHYFSIFSTLCHPAAWSISFQLFLQWNFHSSIHFDVNVSFSNFLFFLFYLTHRILKFSLVFWELKKHNFFSPLGVLKRIEKESWGRKADAKGVFLNMRGFFWGGPLLGWLGGSFKRTLFSIHNDESKYIWKLVTNRWSGP